MSIHIIIDINFNVKFYPIKKATYKTHKKNKLIIVKFEILVQQSNCIAFCAF